MKSLSILLFLLLCSFSVILQSMNVPVGSFFESTIASSSGDNSPRTKILDVGCGWGGVTAKVARRYPEADVLGVDGDLTALQQCREKHEDIPNLSFMYTKIQELSKTVTSRFDLILCNSVLERYPFVEQQQILETMAGLLKRDGKVQIGMIGNYTDTPYIPHLQRVWPGIAFEYDLDPFEKQVFPHSPQSFTVMADYAGLAVKHVEVIEYRREFESRESFRNWIKNYIALFPMPAKISGTKKNSVLKKVEKALSMFGMRGEKDTIVYEFPLLLAWLQKSSSFTQNVTP